MRRLVKMLFGALLLMIPANVSGQQAKDVQEATLMRGFDVTSTPGYTYSIFGDRNSVVGAPVNVFHQGTPVYKKVKTTGSSTSLTTSVASIEPFRGLAAGDLLLFPQVKTQGAVNPIVTEQERVIVTFTDSNNVVVDTAIDLSDGVTFRFKKLLSGATAADAWFSVQGLDKFVVQFDVTTINATSLDSQLQCRTSPFAAPVQIATNNYTAIGGAVQSVSVPYDSCRVGWKINTDTGAQSVSAYLIAQK